MSETTANKRLRKPVSRIGVRNWIRFAGLVILGPVILFATAGTLRWWQGWVAAGIVLLGTGLSRAVVALVHPDLLAERARSLDAGNVKPWDRVIMPVIALFLPLVLWAVAGLDRRFGWSPDFALWVEIGGMALVLVSLVGGTWAMVVNRFFSGTVRIQTEREHSVISDGPYRIVRHPGYASAVFSYPGVSLLLGSLWALIPSAVIAILLVVRTGLEDRTLQEELPGYREYAARTRFRLIPGIW